MKELIEYIAKGLVENPDEVEVTEEWDGNRHVIHLEVAESDMGKVIGRGGRVAESMRALLKVASARQETRAVLDIGD
ncbi:MAG TPA: KH domain-containing protein [Dehalococcoidia bacterium]|nr:KH domain-containing protein [Dehalococcoidia bacterium]